MVSAALRGDVRERDRILHRDLAGGWPFAVIPAAFLLAARRRFQPQVDRRMTTRFAWRFVLNAPGADRFLVRDVDTALRVAIGDEYLGDALPAGLGEIMYATLFGLADDLELSDRAAVELLAEAEGQIALAHRQEWAFPDGNVDASILGDAHWRRTRQPYLVAKNWLPARTGDCRPPRTPRSDELRRRAPRTLAGRYVRSFLVHSGQKREVDSDDVPHQDLLRVMRTSFALAAPLYLHPDPDVREIAELVRKGTWPAGLPRSDLSRRSARAAVAAPRAWR